jgi:hypothetical protein
MTGSAHADIDAVVGLWNTKRQPEAIAMVQGDSYLSAKIEAELARLAAPGRRSLLETDEVSRRLNRDLRAILVAVAAAVV